MDRLIAQYGSRWFSRTCCSSSSGCDSAVPALIVAGALSARESFRSGGFRRRVSSRDDGRRGLVSRWPALRPPLMKLLCRVSLSPDSCVRQTEFRFERWGS